MSHEHTEQTRADEFERRFIARMDAEGWNDVPSGSLHDVARMAAVETFREMDHPAPSEDMIKRVVDVIEDTDRYLPRVMKPMDIARALAAAGLLAGQGAARPNLDAVLEWSRAEQRDIDATRGDDYHSADWRAGAIDSHIQLRNAIVDGKFAGAADDDTTRLRGDEDDMVQRGAEAILPAVSVTASSPEIAREIATTYARAVLLAALAQSTRDPEETPDA